MWVTWPPHDPFWLNLTFLLELTLIHLRANFDVSSFNSSRDIWAFQNSECVSRNPHITTFDLILHHFSLEPSAISLRVTFEVSRFNRSRDISWGPKIPKVGHMTPTWSSWIIFFIFYLRTLITLRVKLEVYSFNRLRDICGFQNCTRSSRDPHMNRLT